MTLVKKYLLVDMEIVNIEDDGDPPILTDSGTESFNESPIADEENIEPTTLFCQPEQTICDRDLDKKYNKNVRNILDKSISVDEDSLIKPLEPIICNNAHSNITNNNNMTTLDIDDHQLMSILRRISCYDNREEFDEDCYVSSPRRVSFPTEIDVLASYKEPDFRFPFELNEVISSQDILVGYQTSCKKHHTIELDVIKHQILEIKNNSNYSSTLNLATVNITMEVCETLEDLFKIVNFHTIIIKECKFSSESIREFLNILEYYNCASEFIVSEPFKEYDAWKCFCNMASKISKLASITIQDINLNEMQIKCLITTVKTNDKITTLKLNNCNLIMLPSFYLVESLMTNTSIQELYLPHTGLYTKEADCLGKFLKRNDFLKVLDISNNFIGDRGLEVLAKGLCTQTTRGQGLSVLVIFNNQITEKSGVPLSNIINECKNLHTLNIGFNNLTDEVIKEMEISLQATKSLEGLGLQSTLLTDIGIGRLADAIQKNNSLKKINLKGNKAIQKDGLDCLSKALTNTRITKIELDETNRNCDDPIGFLELVQQINGICTVNKSKAEQLDTEVCWSLSLSRKVSLNCEPIFNQPYILMEPPKKSSRKKSPSPSPIPSPGCSPIPRSRFSVSPVPDTSPAPGKLVSRFKVFTVQDLGGGGDNLACSPPLDEEDEVRFANVRSSFSSIDSVDSISNNRDSVYDSATPSGESD